MYHIPYSGLQTTGCGPCSLLRSTTVILPSHPFLTHAKCIPAFKHFICVSSPGPHFRHLPCLLSPPVTVVATPSMQPLTRISENMLALPFGFLVRTFPNCDLGSPQNSFRSHSFTAQKYSGVRFPWGHHWPMVTYWWINASSSYSLGRQFWQTFRKFCRIFLWPIQRCIFILAFLCSVVLLCISPVSRDHFLNKWLAYKFLSQAVLLWRTEAKTIDTQNRIVLQSSQALKKGSWSWFTHQSWQTPHCCL